MKKVLTTLLVCMCMLALVPFSAISAEEGEKSTNLTYQVDSAYEWAIHSDIDFGANKGVNQKSGVIAKISSDNIGVKVTKNVIPTGNVLQIKIKNTQEFKIASAGTELTYEVYKGTTKTGTALAAGDVVLSVASGTNAGAQPLYFELSTSTGAAEVAGTYNGTITYEAALSA